MADVFATRVEWSGAASGPTLDPATFSRNLELTIGGHLLPMSAAPGYRGDASRPNPEQLFVASLSACQALTYLFLAARSGVQVTGYSDDAEGRLALVEGKIRVSRVVLRPRIRLQAGADEDTARALVDQAHDGCFIASSVTTTVDVEPSFETASP